uniref:VWA domain-containing protein n=1 Tax=Caldiarchaeum subterraneum TaxID=311458 RepID=A0A7C5QQF6_CALS0
MDLSDLLFLVTEVADRLRGYGVKCGTAETLDAYVALGLVDVANVADLKQVMKLCMVKRLEDYEVFERVFEELLSMKKSGEKKTRASEGGGEGGGTRVLEKARGRGEDQRKALTAYYSPVEVLMKRDIPAPTLGFLRESRRVLKRLRRRLALLPGRRFERSTTGMMDFGETLRQSLKTYGETLTILRKKRKVTRCKLVAIFDVSGSMDTYTEFLMQSMYALARQSVAVEVFVFSTKLMRVSSLLKYFGPKKAAELISRDVNIWGSGTRIGSCLTSFTQNYSGLVSRGTVAIIVSDGWDTGEPELLDKAMRSLKNMVGRIIWVNPHADKPGFKPRTIGMETAMPYIDVLAGMNALKSLKGFTRYFGKSFQPIPKRSRPVSRQGPPFLR